MDAKNVGGQAFDAYDKLVEIVSVIQKIAEVIQDFTFGSRTTPQAVLMDPNQQARISELIWRISDENLTNGYLNADAQQISVSKWQKQNKQNERSWINRIYMACVLYSALHFLAVIFWHDWLFAKESSGLLLFRSFSYLVHAVIVLFASIFVIMHKEPAALHIENSQLVKDLQSWERESIKRSLARATLAVKQCLQYWPWLWVMWFLLYILLSAFYFILYANVQLNSQPIQLWCFPILFNLLNNGTALVFFIMYYELSERTLDIDTPKGMWMILALFLILIAFVEFVVTLFTVNTVDANGHEILPQIQQAFSLLSGILAGVATGLLKVRFGSRMLDVPQIAMVLLVLYAIIQPLFPLLSIQENTTTISIGLFAVNIALYSKIALLVVIHWLRHTHQLTYYMARALQFLNEEGRSRLVFVNEFSPPAEKLIVKTTKGADDVVKQQTST